MPRGQNVGKVSDLHVPHPRYFPAFQGNVGQLPPEGRDADTGCNKNKAIVEDPDAVNCGLCKRYLIRTPQYYNFLRTRWAQKKAGSL